jgi:hypothetical protein
MSRTLSGIPDSGVTGIVGDVLLAGNNIFTGTNIYDVNRPTSAIESTPTAEEFITKQNADNLYSNSAHGLGRFYQAQRSDRLVTLGVVGGNPADGTPNTLNGLVVPLTVTGIDGNADGVCLDFSIVGEWQSQEYDKGVAISRSVSTSRASGYSADLILRSDLDSGVSAQARYIQTFNLAHDVGNRDSTMEGCNGKFIDTTIEDGKFYKYSILLINSSSVTATFTINGVHVSTNFLNRERGVSCITAQEFYTTVI